MTETKKCSVCGKEFSNRGHRAKYCSPKCGRIAEKAKRMPTIAKRAQARNKYNKDVIYAYDQKCAICGWQISEQLIEAKGRTQYAHGNEIHHITPISEGGTNEFGNLILLCPNHHKMADLGLIERDRLYSLVLTKDELEKKKSDDQLRTSQFLARLFGLDKLRDPDNFELEMTE